MAPWLSLKFTGHGTTFLWVALPPLGLMSRLYDRGTQWVPLIKRPEPSSLFSNDSRGWHQHLKTKRETEKKWNEMKSTTSSKWIQTRWEPVWASSPFTIQLSLSIEHADIPLGFAEATSRTVSHSSWASINCSTCDFRKRVCYLCTKKDKGRRFVFNWLKAVMKC